MKNKTYKVYWIDKVTKSIEIDAKNKRDARKKFFSDEIDLSDNEEEKLEYQEGSLKIEKT